MLCLLVLLCLVVDWVPYSWTRSGVRVMSPGWLTAGPQDLVCTHAHTSKTLVYTARVSESIMSVTCFKWVPSINMNLHELTWYSFLTPQWSRVRRERLGWSVDTPTAVVWLRCVLMECSRQSLTVHGLTRMQKLSAHNWGWSEMVRAYSKTV